MKTTKKEIDRVINSFDFLKTHEIMKALKWTYGHGQIPSLSEIKSVAQDLLVVACDKFNETQEDQQYSTGGFQVTVSHEEITLDFVAVSASVFS